MQFLDYFEKVCKSECANVFSVALYENGEIATRSFVDTNPCQNAYSIAKTYIVTAIGLLVDRGLLSTDETVTDILADELPATFHKVWKTTTVEMLLLHRVGLEKHCLDVDCFDASLFGEDYLAYVLNAPISPEFDGQTSTYTDAAYYLLSRIVAARAGMRTDLFLWKHLFLPTGCKEVAWSSCPMGHTIGATGLYIRTEELVKHGALYLCGGVYQGVRILSEHWVQTVFAKGYEFSPRSAGKAYGKGGMRGQMLLLFPETRQAVAWQGYGSYDLEAQVFAYFA